MTPNHIKILYGLNALSLCVVFILSYLYIHHPPQQSLGVGDAANGVIQPVGVPAVQPAANITVGNNKNNPAARKSGPIMQISGGVLTIKDQTSGQTYAVTTNADTKVLLAGSQKDSAEYQKEMDAYYAQIKLLMQDSANNKDALAALTIPIPVELKPDTLADLSVGDSVEVLAASPITGKSFVATTITKAPPPAQ